MNLEKDTIKHYATVLDEVEDGVSELEEEYEKTTSKFDTLLFSLLKLYGIKEGVGILYGKINTKSLEKQIFNIVGNIPIMEAKIINDTLRSVATESYARNFYVIDKNLKLNLKFKPITKSMKDRIIDYPFKGLKFSERLYVNHMKLVTDVKATIVDGLTSGKSIEDMARELNGKMGIGLKNSTRIIRTEASKVWNFCQEEAWKDTGVVRKVIFIATLDGRTSDICRSKDGKIYDINDPNKPIPPLHPNCRSTLGAYFDEPPKERKDNITKANIKYRTYEEWLKSTP